MKICYRHVIFSLLFFLLMLFVVISVLEIAAPLIFGKWWPSINLVGNPDHRMTQDMNDDVNSDGVRSASEAGEFREEDFNIIVLGDSFVYGMFLGRQDTTPYRLEELAHAEGYKNIRVINFGWISSSPYLSLRLLQEIGKKYKPDMVIEVVDMTDFWDDTFYRRAVERKGFFSIGHWMPATSLLLGKWGRELIQQDWYSINLWGVPWQRYFAMERPLEQTRPYLDALVGNLDETNAYVNNELHARFAVFVMPRSVQYSERETPDDHSTEYTRLGPYSQEPFRYFAEIAPQKSYPVTSLLNDFRNTTAFPLTFE
ncbi:MAG TPA: hypothetical protein VLB90_11745, partial [Pseudomonadales bacterium]|nr:hypothetical protein [Pseudomonadales bacterium]